MLTMEEIYIMASYTDSNDNPNCASALVLSALTDAGDPILKNSMDANAPLVINSVGGCAVVSIYFKKEDKAVFDNMASACMDWLNDEDGNGLALSYHVIPFALKGTVTVIFQYLAFCDFYEAEDHIKLILAFDNTQTIFLADDGVDFDAIQKSAEDAATANLTELERQIREEQEKEDEINRQINEIMMPKFALIDADDITLGNHSYEENGGDKLD